MITRPISTPKITPRSTTLLALLDDALPELQGGSVVAITSKIVSLCQGRVVPLADANLRELIRAEASRYLPSTTSRYGVTITVTRDTLIPHAGIDESNGDGHYILWPADPQRTANEVRRHLARRSGHRRLGVIITDSTTMPLRWGTIGLALAHSGFRALNNYIGQPDLFDRPFSVSQANVAGGLAAAATLAMGEGTEQTPIAILEELPFVTWQPRNPTPAELAALRIDPTDDLYAPLIEAVDWLPGNGS